MGAALREGTITKTWRRVPLAWRARIRHIPNFFRRLVWGWRGVPVDVEGVRFLVDYASGTEFARARVFAELEGDFTRAFGVLAAQARVVVDVGANIGMYSLFAARKNPEARIYALEPEPHNLAALRRNLAVNGLDNVVSLPLGLARQEATVTLRLDGLLENAAGTGHRVVEGDPQGPILEILVASLDHLAAAGVVEPPDLVKMDIEGYELNALRGMERLLREHRPDLLIEVHPDMLADLGQSDQELDAYLADLGYRKRLFAGVDPNLFRAWYWPCGS